MRIVAVVILILSLLGPSASAVLPQDHGLDTHVYVVATITDFQLSWPNIIMDFKKQQIEGGKVVLNSTSAAPLSGKAADFKNTLENLTRVAINMSRLCFKIENPDKPVGKTGRTSEEKLEFENSFTALGGLINQLVSYRFPVRLFVLAPEHYKTLVATGDITTSGTNVFKNTLQLAIETIRRFHEKNPNDDAFEALWKKLAELQLKMPNGDRLQKIDWLAAYFENLKLLVSQTDDRANGDCLDPFKR